MRTAFKCTLHLSLLLLPALFCLPASATVFKCVGPDGGITYTNEPSRGTHCSQLDANLPVSSIPAPPRSASTPAPQPATAASFPRVSPDAQRSRDDTRRQILENELNAELLALETAKTALTDRAGQLAPSAEEGALPDALSQPFRDQIELHERNIEALQREIRGLR